MNKFIGIGRLVRDAETRYSQGENSKAVERFTVAVDRRFKTDGEQNADFIPCVAFGKTAEFVEKYFKQGNKIAVEGRIQTSSYTNKDGVKVYTTEIMVEQVEFCESKGNGGSNDVGARPQPNSAVGDGFMNIPDGIDEDELPFN